MFFNLIKHFPSCTIINCKLIVFSISPHLKDPLNRFLIYTHIYVISSLFMSEILIIFMPFFHCEGRSAALSVNRQHVSSRRFLSQYSACLLCFQSMTCFPAGCIIPSSLPFSSPAPTSIIKALDAYICGPASSFTQSQPYFWLLTSCFWKFVSISLFFPVCWPHKCTCLMWNTSGPQTGSLWVTQPWLFSEAWRWKLSNASVINIMKW